MGPTLNADAFASLADAQVGKPYVLGAEASITDNNPPKFDCSELVEWLYGRNGTPIGDLAASQFDKTVAVKTPTVGDLVFLRNNARRWNKIGHVAILTKKLSNGDWRIIEARGRASGVVRTTLSYWQTRGGYTGVRRFPGFALKVEALTTVKDDHSKFRVATYNAQHPAWGGNVNYDSDARFIRDRLKASVFFLQEARSDARDAMRRVLGSSRYLTWPTGLVSVHWDSVLYDDLAHEAISLGSIAHRAMKVDLVSKINGSKFTACSIHVRSNDAMPRTMTASQKTSEKLKDVKCIIEFLKDDKDVVVGGDWSTKHAMPLMVAAGYRLASPYRDTMFKKIGSQTVDVIYVKGDIDVRNLHGSAGPGELHNPAGASDHMGAVGDLTFASGQAL